VIYESVYIFFKNLERLYNIYNSQIMLFAASQIITDYTNYASYYRHRAPRAKPTKVKTKYLTWIHFSRLFTAGG